MYDTTTLASKETDLTSPGKLQKEKKVIKYNDDGDGGRACRRVCVPCISHPHRVYKLMILKREFLGMRIMVLSKLMVMMSLTMMLVRTMLIV